MARDVALARVAVLRAQIDDADLRLASILDLRAFLVAQIAEAKEATSLPACDGAREAEVLLRFSAGLAREMASGVVRASRDWQIRRRLLASPPDGTPAIGPPRLPAPDPDCADFRPDGRRPLPPPTPTPGSGREMGGGLSLRGARAVEILFWSVGALMIVGVLLALIFGRS